MKSMTMPSPPPVPTILKEDYINDDYPEDDEVDIKGNYTVARQD